MAKFRFPLQKVLEHRKTLENIAQRDFQDALALLTKDENELQKMLDELHEARLEAGRVQAIQNPTVPERLKQIYDFSVLQDVRIKRQKAKVEASRELVEAKREILRDKAIDSKIMEKLKGKRKEEFLQRLRVMEQKEIDEINVLRFEPKDGE